MYFAKKGCLLISSPPFAPSLREGSRCRRPVMTWRASGRMSSEKRRGSVKIRWYILQHVIEVCPDNSCITTHDVDVLWFARTDRVNHCLEDMTYSDAPS